jgi:hypothetical protein
MAQYTVSNISRKRGKKSLALLAIPILLLILFLPLQSETASNTYFPIKVAFHIHTSYSNDSPYDVCPVTPEQVVDAYHAAGYDAIAITDYNSKAGSWAGIARAQAEAKKFGMIIIPGEEYITQFPLKNGQVVWKHVTALFLTSQISDIYSCYRTNSIEAIFTKIHAQGGLGIVAHSWQLNPNIVCGTSNSPWWPYRTAKYVDGWEIENWGPGMNQDEIANVIGRSKIYIASHDFQTLPVPTERYNILYVSSFTLNGIKNALINQRNIVYYYGQVYGSKTALNLYYGLSD